MFSHSPVEIDTMCPGQRITNKRVLILTQLFAPSIGVGALRSTFFSKYLPLFGWDPFIITSSEDYHPLLNTNISGLPPQEKVVRIPGTNQVQNDTILFRLNRLARIFYLPETTYTEKLYKGWVKVGMQVISRIQPDVILASSGPDSAYVAAYILSKRTGIPFIIDFRDIAEQFSLKTVSGKLRIQRIIKRRKKFTSAAAACTTVSNGLASQLISKSGIEAKVIYNGFDHEIHASLRGKEEGREKFTICYAGRIWDPKHRDPRPLFNAIDRLINNDVFHKENFLVQFVGTEPELVNRFSEGFSCAGNIQIIPRVSYEESICYMMSANILLHLSHQQQKGILTTKLFDYMAVGRPILSIPGDGDEVDNLLIQTCSGISAGNIDSIVNFLETGYKQYTRDKAGKRVVEDLPMGFSRLESTKNLSTLLNDIV